MGPLKRLWSYFDYGSLWVLLRLYNLWHSTNTWSSFFINALLADVYLTKKSLSRFILCRRHNWVCIILGINLKRTIPYSHGFDAFCPRMTVDIFESSKVHLLFFQDAIVAKITTRLLQVELVLKDVDFVVKRLQFLEKWTWAFFLIANSGTVLILFNHPLSLLLLSMHVPLSRLFIKLTCHEIFIRVQVLIQVHDIIYGNRIGPPLHGSLRKLFLLVFFTIFLHVRLPVEKGLLWWLKIFYYLPYLYSCFYISATNTI